MINFLNCLPMAWGYMLSDWSVWFLGKDILIVTLMGFAFIVFYLASWEVVVIAVWNEAFCVHPTLKSWWCLLEGGRCSVSPGI